MPKNTTNDYLGRDSRLFMVAHATTEFITNS